MPETCGGHHIQATTFHMYVGQLPHSLRKNELKVDHRHRCTNYSYIALWRQWRCKYWRSWIRWLFPKEIIKGLNNKTKTRKVELVHQKIPWRAWKGDPRSGTNTSEKGLTVFKMLLPLKHLKKINSICKIAKDCPRNLVKEKTDGL